MSQQREKDVIAHFLRWSGGFSPESFDQITVFVDYALLPGMDAEEVRQTLKDWMQREADEWYKSPRCGTTDAS